jgi:hypothetical protein
VKPYPHLPSLILLVLAPVGAEVTSPDIRFLVCGNAATSCVKHVTEISLPLVPERGGKKNL